MAELQAPILAEGADNGLCESTNPCSCLAPRLLPSRLPTARSRRWQHLPTRTAPAGGGLVPREDRCMPGCVVLWLGDPPTPLQCISESVVTRPPRLRRVAPPPGCEEAGTCEVTSCVLGGFLRRSRPRSLFRASQPPSWAACTHPGELGFLRGVQGSAAGLWGKGRVWAAGRGDGALGRCGTERCFTPRLLLSPGRACPSRLCRTAAASPPG